MKNTMTMFTVQINHKCANARIIKKTLREFGNVVRFRTKKEASDMAKNFNSAQVVPVEVNVEEELAEAVKFNRQAGVSANEAGSITVGMTPSLAVFVSNIILNAFDNNIEQFINGESVDSMLTKSTQATLDFALQLKAATMKSRK